MLKAKVSLISVYLLVSFLVNVSFADEVDLKKILGPSADALKSIENLEFISVGSGGPVKNRVPPVFYGDVVRFAASGSAFYIKSSGYVGPKDGPMEQLSSPIVTAAFDGETLQGLFVDGGVLYILKKMEIFQKNYPFTTSGNMGVLDPYKFIGYCSIVQKAAANKVPKEKSDGLLPEFSDYVGTEAIDFALSSGNIVDPNFNLEGQDCVVATFPSGFMGGVESFFKVYFSKKHNFYPIGWDWCYKEKSYIRQTFRIDVSKLAKSGSFVYPTEYEKVAYTFKEGDAESHPMSKMKFIEKNVNINSPKFDNDVFTIDPAQAERIFDVDANVWLRMPKS